MKRYAKSSGAILRWVVAGLATGAVLTSCGDDDGTSATTIAATTNAAATTAATTVATTAAPATSDAASGDACADRDALRASVAALTDVNVVADGTNALTAAVDAVKSDLEKVRASAGSIVGPQVQAVQDAIAATEAGIKNLGQGGAVEAAAALSTLSSATTTLLTSLEGGGPCS